MNFPCIVGKQVMVELKAICDHDSDRLATSCADSTDDRHKMCCSSYRNGAHRQSIAKQRVRDPLHDLIAFDTDQQLERTLWRAKGRSVFPAAIPS